MVKFCKSTYNLTTCAEFTDFCFLICIAVMFCCCLLCSSLFLYVSIVYLSCIFYFCGASCSVIKNEWASGLAPAESGTGARTVPYVDDDALTGSDHLRRGGRDAEVPYSKERQ